MNGKYSIWPNDCLSDVRASRTKTLLNVPPPTSLEQSIKKYNFTPFWKWNSNKEKRTVKKTIISPTTTTTEYCIMKRCVVREGNGEWRTVDDEPFLGCTVFPWIINYFAPKGGDYSRGATFSNIAHRKSCTKCFTLLSHYFLKMITLNKLNMDFLSVPSLFLWLIFNVLQ